MIRDIEVKYQQKSWVGLAIKFFSPIVTLLCRPASASGMQYEIYKQILLLKTYQFEPSVEGEAERDVTHRR